MRRFVVLGLVPVVACSIGAEASGRGVANEVGCAQRAETSSPTSFNDPHFKGRRFRVVVGPVELRGVRTYASPRAFAGLPRRDGYFPVKVALVVQARRSLDLAVRGTDPRPVRLAYGTAEPKET